MVGRIQRTADFERVLAHAPRARTQHFSAHHVAASPLAPSRGGSKPGCTELSTSDAPSCSPPVDELPTGWWLGMVVPKRHARRSVTRNLIKRQMRQVMDVMVQRARGNPAEGLPRGLWVLRLKSPFDPRQFHSPASDPLRQAAHDEIESLLARAVVGAPSPGRGSSRGPRDRSGPAALQTAPAA